MTDEFELRSISHNAVGNAIDKAKHYRLLNQPAEAESICRDVLQVEPDNQEAIIVLVLALTDQFGEGGTSGALRQAHEQVAQLTDPYLSTYYGGIVTERNARAFLSRKMSRTFAYSGFREAMDWYEKAKAICPEGNDDAILRWNSCVRAIRRHKLRPRADEGELPLE